MSAGSVCPRCGERFACGMLAGAARCWCADLPPLCAPPDPAAGCFCPGCMRALLAAPGAGGSVPEHEDGVTVAPGKDPAGGFAPG
ncbi:MAG: cysteine-rich CWC family protein [Sulfuritalea sp.]|nr:cysteine-rich CWC family protein [Sulfuritalea sp.]